MEDILAVHSVFLVARPSGKRGDFRRLDLAVVKLNGVSLSTALLGSALFLGCEMVGCELSDVTRPARTLKYPWQSDATDPRQYVWNGLIGLREVAYPLSKLNR